MINLLDSLPNPKRDKSSVRGRSGWYPYYAGYSAAFAEEALKLASVSAPRILDPWNGSGTTTAVSAGKALDSFGFDLNPVMVIVARARLLNKRERPSLLPIAKLITSLQSKRFEVRENDPLRLWLAPSAVQSLRQLEFGIQRALFGLQEWTVMEQHVVTHDISDFAAFFYVALFRTVRGFLTQFQSSNPTWLKSPDSPAARLRPNHEMIVQRFLMEITAMDSALDSDDLEKDGKVKIGVAKSQDVPLPSGSADFVLSSPPYCTRIDYAAATRVELSVLGMPQGSSFDSLRNELLGTPTVPRHAIDPNPLWGPICTTFLSKVKQHPSKASAGYYLKGHCQYFDGIFKSLGEIQRCLSAKGRACLVVQDSHYKNIHNDLAGIFIEMAVNSGLALESRRDFPLNRSMGQVNTASRAYRKSGAATESVLLFTKN